MNLPDWAMQTVTADDWHLARDAHRLASLHIQWPDLKTLRAWAKGHGWPAPWWSFEAAFLTRMFADESSFRAALQETGIRVRAPRREYTLPAEELAELDALYAQRSSSGRPEQWGALVEALRAIRRAVEASVLVRIQDEPTSLDSWQQFYAWAHGRYHLLEDGYDHWIGDDTS